MSAATHQHLDGDGLPVHYVFVGMATPDQEKRIAEDINKLVREHNRREANRELEILHGPWNGMVIGQVWRKRSVWIAYENEGRLAIVDTTARYRFWASWSMWDFTRNEIPVDAVKRVRLYRAGVA